jgi:hypothetical protein
MATLDDVRRIGLALPGAAADEDGVGVLNKDKIRGMAWRWKERVEPKKPRIPREDIVAIRTASVEERDGLIASDPLIYFTEPHYNGYPAVLVRLEEIGLEELEELLIDAWICLAPKAEVKAFKAHLLGKTDQAL